MAAVSRLDRVIVSAEARAWGFEVPFLRPAALAQDYVGPDQVLLHALQTLGAGGAEFDVVALIQPTAPFITAEHINACLDELDGSNGNCCFLARPVSEPALLPAGAVWVVRRAALPREQRINVAPMRAVTVARERAVDIDEEYDFIVAEAMARHHGFAPPTRAASMADAGGA